MTGADSGPAWVTGVCWLNAMMRMNERVANETRVMARWRLSSVPSDSNGAAVAALTVRIGRNRQTPWGFRPASAGARAGSESGGGSIAHAYQARHTTFASRFAARVGWKVAPPNGLTSPRASSKARALATEAAG